MTPKRLSAKFFLKDSSSLEVDDVIPVFHQWISQQVVDEMLIDVAVYSHVAEGPSLMLVALEADYVLDNADGKQGLRYIRKRALPLTLMQALAQVIAQAATACNLLAHSTDLAAPPLFDASTVEIEILDKLNYPGGVDVKPLESALLAVGQKMYGEGTLRLERPEVDSRRPVKLLLMGTGGVSFEDIVSRLKAGDVLQSLPAEESAR